jgi:hypothetical protein
MIDMAQRRMFSNRIANSAKFLQMPTEAQLLYFHMILRADDDGVVEAYPLVKLLGTPQDAFKVLLVREFIRQLNEDQVVVVTDWLEHNNIRADRKVDSIYRNLLEEKAPDIPMIEPKPRSDVRDNSRRLSVACPRAAEVRLGKVRLGKDRDTSARCAEGGQKGKHNPLGAEIINAFEAVDPKNKRYYKIPVQRDACDFLIENYELSNVLRVVDWLPKLNGQPYFPTITTPVQLRDKWVTLHNAVARLKADKKSQPHVEGSDEILKQLGLK